MELAIYISDMSVLDWCLLKFYIKGNKFFRFYLRNPDSHDKMNRNCTSFAFTKAKIVFGVSVLSSAVVGISNNLFSVVILVF